MPEDVANPDIPELAEDGSPLGTLKVAGRVYAKNPMGELERVADSELRKSNSVDLTGEDGADDELVDLYEGYNDQDKRRLALVRYVKDGLTAAEVARELKVPEQTVLMWAYHGKWNKAASREISVRMEEEARSLANLRLKHREQLLTQQIEDASKLQKRLMEKVDSDEVSMKSAAESLAALAKVQNSAMGVAESGDIITGSKDEKKDQGPANNTFIYMGGSLPVARKAKEGDVIDV